MRLTRLRRVLFALPLAWALPWLVGTTPASAMCGGNIFATCAPKKSPQLLPRHGRKHKQRAIRR